MEPNPDPELKEWLEEQAVKARRERAELYTKLEAEARTRQLSEAGEILASIPPLLPGQSRTFVKIFEAAPSTEERKGELRTVEGIVFDVYGVETGSMSGSDNFDAFNVISDGDLITSWRKDSLEVRRRNFVRIKFLQRDHLDDRDHIDDPVLEVWVDSTGPYGWKSS
jgi:hypothetical protein